MENKEFERIMQEIVRKCYLDEQQVYLLSHILIDEGFNCPQNPDMKVMFAETINLFPKEQPLERIPEETKQSNKLPCPECGSTDTFHCAVHGMETCRKCGYDGYDPNNESHKSYCNCIVEPLQNGEREELKEKITNRIYPLLKIMSFKDDKTGYVEACAEDGVCLIKGTEGVFNEVTDIVLDLLSQSKKEGEMNCARHIYNEIMRRLQTGELKKVIDTTEKRNGVKTSASVYDRDRWLPERTLKAIFYGYDVFLQSEPLESLTNQKDI